MLINKGFLPKDTNNDSIHATGYVARYNNEANDFITRIEAIEDKASYDVVVVFGGVNDRKLPMGASGGDKTAEFIPAVDYFYSYLYENFVNAKIGVILPLLCNVPGDQYSTLEIIKERSNYIKQVASSYMLPILDLTNESGFYPYNETFKNRWTYVYNGTTADGIHPNEEYERERLAPMIQDFLRKFA